jgi:hypothetical protein
VINNQRYVTEEKKTSSAQSNGRIELST